MNEVFGFNSWSYKVRDKIVDYVEHEPSKDKYSNNIII
jgi:recombination DNA repair RAD52 pathway protein